MKKLSLYTKIRWLLIILISFLFIVFFINSNTLISRISSILIIIGLVFNLSAVALNDWRMPVYQKEFERHPDMKIYLKSDRHMVLTNKKRIKVLFLCDIFKIRPFSKSYYFSIGDVFLFLGVFINIFGFF